MRERRLITAAVGDAHAWNALQVAQRDTCYHACSMAEHQIETGDPKYVEIEKSLVLLQEMERN